MYTKWKFSVYCLLLWFAVVSNSEIFSMNLETENQTNQSEKAESSKLDEKFMLISIRYGQGGFNDSRSPLNKLGGGQLALDFIHLKTNLALSISGEYYTNSADPTHSYEISGLTCVNLLYIPWGHQSKRYYAFCGGGIGQLEVPKSEVDPEKTEKAMMFNLEAGMNYTLLWKFGFYGVGKYLYSQKKVNGEKFIDFSEFIFMIGITINFGI